MEGCDKQLAHARVLTRGDQRSRLAARNFQREAGAAQHTRLQMRRDLRPDFIDHQSKRRCAGRRKHLHCFEAFA